MARYVLSCANGERPELPLANVRFPSEALIEATYTYGIDLKTWERVGGYWYNRQYANLSGQLQCVEYYIREKKGKG